MGRVDPETCLILVGLPMEIDPGVRFPESLRLRDSPLRYRSEQRSCMTGFNADDIR